MGHSSKDEVAAPPGSTGELGFVTASDRLLRWTTKSIVDTPSRRDGIDEKTERAERFVACHFARGIIRLLFSDSSDQKHDELSKSAQCLACYYLQVFYMFRSLRQEDSKVVAVAAAFLACKVVDSPRRMRDVLRSNNQMRAQKQEPELGEDEQRSLRERVLKLEIILLRIIRFDFDLVVRIDATDLDKMMEGLLCRVTNSEAFKTACKGRPPGVDANALRPNLLTISVNFFLDASMGFSPLLFPPRVIGAGALAFGLRYLRREMSFGELAGHLEAADGTVEKGEVESAIQEIMNVFRTKTSCEKEGPRPSLAATPPPGQPAAGTAAAQIRQNTAAATPASTQGSSAAGKGQRTGVVGVTASTTGPLQSPAAGGTSGAGSATSSSRSVGGSAVLVTGPVGVSPSTAPRQQQTAAQALAAKLMPPPPSPAPRNKDRSHPYAKPPERSPLRPP
eukprot:TRINITY_DN66564_c0_g1_i1.p1 TRINITY_DN66564_c0_g1~~TRINITY_DN66564_c0_g1_i1.p1  ORF type:complete len:450 (-),score=67.55 TRINITY_DN66564_c0_g1_i1:177-1526(-)